MVICSYWYIFISFLILNTYFNIFFRIRPSEAGGVRNTTMLEVEQPTTFPLTETKMRSRKSSASSSMSKGNLRQHTVQLHRGIPTSDKNDICCAYCENYGRDMSQHKHAQIDSWRNDVNKAFSPSTKRAKPSNKLAYDGSRTENGKMTAMNRNTSVTAISLRLAEVALNAPGVVADQKSVRNNHKRALSASRASFVSYLSRNSGSSQFSHTYNNPLASPRSSTHARSSSMCARSSSNELLNVMTIDDYHSVHRPKVRFYSQSMENDTFSKIYNGHPMNNTPLLHVNGKTGSHDRQLAIKAGGSTQGSLTTESNSKSTIFMDDLMQEPNHAVLNALDDMIGSREVMKNDAFTGLYKHDPSQKAKFTVKKESKRFKRMNDQLHKQIETEILSKNYLLKPRGRLVSSRSTDNGSHYDNENKHYLCPPDYLAHQNLRSSLRTPGDLTSRSASKKRVQLQVPESVASEDNNEEQTLTQNNDKNKDSLLQTLLDMEGDDVDTLETSSGQAIN